MLRSFLKNERANISLHQNQPNSLSLEALEDRMMLSSVEIFAAGATGEENLDLLVNGEVVQTFFNVGGDASTRQFERFTFETDQTVTPGNIESVLGRARSRRKAKADSSLAIAS